MTCPDCERKTEVIKTMVLQAVTQRLRRCECGVSFLTTETVTRKLVGSSSTAGQPPANSPATHRQPPGNRSPLSSSSGSDLSLSVSEIPDQTGAREAKTEPIVRTFLVVGKDGPTWGLTESAHKKLTQAYPGVDADAEYAKIDFWIEGHPQRRKTARGMKAFLQRWFDKAQNDARRGPARQQAVPFAVAAEAARKERINEARFRRITEELTPKQPLPSPREEYLRSVGGGK